MSWHVFIIEKKVIKRNTFEMHTVDLEAFRALLDTAGVIQSMYNSICEFILWTKMFSPLKNSN